MQASENNTVKEILSIIQEMPGNFQKEVLKQLKLQKSIMIARQIDASHNSKEVISDDEIAEMIHNFRIGKI